MSDVFACSNTIYRIDKRHHHCRFDNFDWTGRERLKQYVGETYIPQMVSMGAPHLLLTGDPGIGKSHLNVALYRAGVINAGTFECYFTNVPDLCDRIKKGFETGDNSDFEDMDHARVFIGLDDLFGRPLTPWELDNVLYRALNIAYTNAAALCLTTNYTWDQLVQTLRSHEVDRIMENLTHIPMTGESWRQR
jgi:DNA replication protein DnaC